MNCSDKKKRTPNALINEKSPYLLQHAYNPVNWYPWREEAFTRAKEEHKLISQYWLFHVPLVSCNGTRIIRELKMVTKTLYAMACGGIFDQLDVMNFAWYTHISSLPSRPVKSLGFSYLC